MAIHAQTNCTLTTKPAKTSLLGGHFIYNGTWSTQKTPHSVNIVQTIEKNGIDVTNDPTKWDYNVHVGSNGIKLRNNETDLSSWTNAGFIFYNPSNGNEAMKLTGSNLTFYASDGQTVQAVFGGTGASVKGAITATSLTIGGDGSGNSYDGVAAINSTGYVIEIIDDVNAAPSGTTVSDNQTYLYPIMRRNGEIVNYLLTSDSTVVTGKNYYIRSYDSTTQTYIYTLVVNPTGNPKELSYYEAIDKTQYVWSYNGSVTSIYGDTTLGGTVADYNKTYRVSYTLSDDVVGETPSAQVIEVDPQKYITQIDEYGIKIHPETWTNQSSYIQLDGTGMEVFEIGQTDVSVAFFGANGSRIGAESTSNVITTSNGIAVRDGLAELAVMSKDGFDVKTYDANDNEVVIAHLGFGPGTDSGGGISDAPYYTLGTRVSGSTVGNYSHAEGYNTIASAYCAHAEGGTRSVIVSPETIASGEYSHAEGGSTTASAGCSHAEGYATVASGPHSHAEGFYTTAEGTSSHAGGCGTTVIKHNQTAIGEYNEIDNYADTHGKYAFIIGNGISNNARSNALTVAWNGNTTIAGTLTQSSDRRLKTHQSYLSTDAINFIQNLKPAYFKKDNQSHVGFYAQDVEKIDPWNCMIGEMNGYKTLGYTEIIAPLVTYCQHLEERIRQLEEK